VRRVLDVVRPGLETEPELAPQPGLARLEELIERVRVAGMPVVLRIEGTRAELPAGIDLSAFRIVQEALTNTLKHATRASQATVVLRFDPKNLTVEVCDDGTAGPAASSSSGTGTTGRGLIGMRERVALYGGELVAGPRAGGGFEVRARFPLDTPPP
jgi:signal transduction histidine kinase